MKNFLITLCIITFLSITAFTEELKFALASDAGRKNDNSMMVYRSLVKYNTRQLIMAGDNLYVGTYEQLWNPAKKAGFTFDVIAIGNHNLGYAKEIKYFEMPGEYFAKEYANGEIQYLVLNSDNTKNVDQQIAWLKEQLEKSTAKQIYLVYHHPTFTVGMHKWSEKKNFQLKIRPVLKTYRSKITALILGHDHIATLIHFDSLPVIISGSIQSLRDEKPVNNVQDGVQVKTAILLDRQPYWVQQITNGEDVSEFYFIRAKDNKVLCKAVIQTGMRATHSCVRGIASN